MLARNFRITSRHDFWRVKKYGTKKEGRFFSWVYLSNQKGRKRFGIIVSNKISKKATQRNKLKRYFRQTAKELDSFFPENTDNVIYVKKEALEEPFSEIKNDFKTIFNKSH